MPHVHRALAISLLLATFSPLAGEETVAIMALYTPGAKASQGGQEGIEAVIDLAIAQTNAAFANSQVDVQVELVYVGEVAYDETGSGYADLDALVDPDDGKMDDVHQLRDLYCADVVSLFVPLFDVCGIATGELLADPSPENEGYAFHLVDPDCQYKYTFTHELGHGFGCGHDAGNGNGAFPWAHGHVGSAFRTLMAYGSDEDTPRILQFSSPLLTWGGEPAGTAEADNASVVQQTAAVLAAFRTGGALTCYAGPDLSIGLQGETSKLVTLSGFASTCGAPVDGSYEWFLDGAPLGEGPELVHEFGIGTWGVSLVVTAGGEVAEDSATILVVPNQPPVADISTPTLLVDEEGAGAVFSVFDGSGSFDPDGDPLAFEWRLDGDQVATGAFAFAVVGLGLHDLELRVTDDQGAEGTAQVQILVKEPIQVPLDYPTLQAAVDAALPYDAIVVAPGVYKGPGNRDVSIDQPLTILSLAGPDATIVDCENQPSTSGFRVVLPPAPEGFVGIVRIEGFTIQGASAAGPQGGGISIDATQDPGAWLTVRNNRIRKNKATTGGGVSVRGGDWLYLAGNRIEGNAAWAGGGIHVADTASVYVRDCVIAGNVAGPGGGAGILTAGASSSVQIVGATIVRNRSTAGPSALYCGPFPHGVVDSILWENAGPSGVPPIGGGPDVVVNYSDVQGGWPGLGNVDVDPLFLGPAAGDWHLAPTSPCIDAANGFVASPYDVEGNPRYDDPGVANTGIGPAADLGAHEYQGTLEIVVGTPPPAVLGTPYSIAMTAAGGDGPTYQWQVLQGLPPGLALLPSDGPTATIAGVPTQKGPYAVTVQVTDSAGEIATRTFWIYVF